MMKFLCLHGAYGNAENFKVQLAPFTKEVERSGSGTFEWINGSSTVQPPPGFEDYFGAPPHHRFLNFDGLDTVDNTLEQIRDFPPGKTAEDAMRRITLGGEFTDGRALSRAMKKLFEMLDVDCEIDGILGYSEGAAVAASLIIEEQRLLKREGRPRRIKCAVFFGGWPPSKLVEGEARILLADECDEVLDIPTCHVVGCKDPWLDGSIALYNMCDEDMAILFDHGKGHTVPRDATTINELATSIGDTVKTAEVSLCG